MFYKIIKTIKLMSSNLVPISSGLKLRYKKNKQ